MRAESGGLGNRAADGKQQGLQHDRIGSDQCHSGTRVVTQAHRLRI
jgi:hypothetical protein